jgi:hypothetical protein
MPKGLDERRSSYGRRDSRPGKPFPLLRFSVERRGKRPSQRDQQEAARSMPGR